MSLDPLWSEQVCMNQLYCADGPGVQQSGFACKAQSWAGQQHAAQREPHFRGGGGGEGQRTPVTLQSRLGKLVVHWATGTCGITLLAPKLGHSTPQEPALATRQDQGVAWSVQAVHVLSKRITGDDIRTCQPGLPGFNPPTNQAAGSGLMHPAPWAPHPPCPGAEHIERQTAGVVCNSSSEREQGGRKHEACCLRTDGA